MRKGWREILTSMLCVGALIAAGCYSNNCPLENTVYCNYKFYDSQGTPISYSDTITVSTLKPGYKTVYIYRKLGNKTVTKESQDTELMNQGYTETQTMQRNDTILLNRIYGASSISLPISYFHTTDTLVFTYERISQCDTIYIEHESYPYVEMPECGSHRFHSLKSITATSAAIDHAEIDNPNVNYDGNNNIKLFFNGVVE